MQQVAIATFPDSKTAKSIVSTLLEERLIACGNLIPNATSLYRWEGKIQSDAEILAILKTDESRIAALKPRFVELHPYECPELIITAITDGHPAYLQWIVDSTSAQ